jgi:hypothetical protein
MDQWCEQRMWKSMGYDSLGAEPFAAFSGIFLILIPFVYGLEDEPPLFIAFKASFVFLGVGTIAFHWIPNLQDTTAINVGSFDWFPLVTTLALMALLYLQPALQYLTNFGMLLVFCVFYAWVVFLLMGVDNVTFDYFQGFSWAQLLNALLVGPLFLIFAVATAVNLGYRALRPWLWLVVAHVLWLINVYACDKWYILSLFHAAYHVIMAFTLWDIACLSII